MNNYIQTTIISLVVAFLFGLLFNAITIAPVVAEAKIATAEAATPIKINAKKALKLYAAIDCLEEEQHLIGQAFSKTLNNNDYKEHTFKINHDMVSYKHIIKTDLTDIKCMVKKGEYSEASKAIKEYKHLLREQVRDIYCYLPLSYMFVCLCNADKLGVIWYFES